MPADRRVSRGIALIPEGRKLFASMTVEENLRLGAYSRGRGTGKEYDDDLAMVYELFSVLGERSTQTAGTLSGGEQQMLAIGRALMSRPRLLLLDEPSLGLAPQIIREIFVALDRLRERGLTLFLVEQDAKIALSHADRGYVMRTGRIALAGSADELMADDDVRLIYLGAWHDKE
jgi:branched-chain amino acid transport system ATP-binding protein